MKEILINKKTLSSLVTWTSQTGTILYVIEPVLQWSTVTDQSAQQLLLPVLYDLYHVH